MRILLIPAHFPYPPDDGAKIPTFYLLKYLSRRHEMTLATITESEEQEKYLPELQQYCRRIQLFRKRPVWSPLNPLLALLLNIPLIIACSYSKEMKAWLARELADSTYDLVLVQFLNCSINLPDPLTANSVLHIWSIESLTFRRYLDISLKNKLNLLVWEEMRRWRQYEKTICEKFDHCITISEEDKAVLKQRVPRVPTTVMANGVDIEYFTQRQSPGETPQKALVYTGLMKYFPNSDAVGYFCGEILPLVRRMLPGIPFYIVGKNPPRAVQKLARLENVFVTGYVDDVRQYLTPASVFVVPLRAGTGLRNKILEAMAMRVPVVSTSIGAEGIKAKNGVHLYISDDPAEFAEKVAEVALNRDTRSRLTDNGRRLVEEHYSWESAARTVERIFEEIEEEKKARPKRP